MAAWLVALTEEARIALRGDQHVIERFPFKVGRESRLAGHKARPDTEQRAGTAPQLNDLYLVEPGDLLNVSREHFAIEHEGDEYVLVDRGSVCGTLVEGRRIGGERSGGRVEIHDRDVIVVGTSGSPFVFKFRTER